MKQPKNDQMRSNTAGANTAAPSSLPKEERAMNRSAPSKGSPKSIPSTAGYVGKRIK